MKPLLRPALVFLLGVALWLSIGLAAAVLFLPHHARAAEYAIDAARLPAAGTWTPNAISGGGGVGVDIPGGIPFYPNQVDITQAPYFADNTGVADVHDIFYAAYDAVKNTNKALYLPAGTYRFNTAFSTGTFDGGFVIRGAGPATILKFYNNSDPGGQAFMTLGNGTSYAWFQNGGATQNPIVSGITKGSDTITVSGDASDLTVGALCQIAYDEGDDPANPVISVRGFRYSGNQPMRRNMITITAKSGNTLTVSPKLYGDPPTTGVAKIMRAFACNYYLGVEDLTIDISQSNTQEAIQFSQTRGAWLKNVVVKGAVNYQVAVFDSLFFEMRGCTLDGGGRSGNNGAGILIGTSCSGLYEDNIIKFSQPPIEVNFGSSGNVFAYNLVLGASHSMDGNHGPHNEYNLYEGNCAAQFESDGYYGGSSRDMVFRNFLTGIFTQSNGTESQGALLALKRFTRWTTFLGNTCQKPGFTWTNNSEGIGQPNIGNGDFGSPTVSPINGTFWPEWATRYSAPVGETFWQAHDDDVEGTLLRLANHYLYNGARDHELSGGTTLPSSLYRAAKPAFFGTLAWPPYDATAAPPVRTLEAIPAGYRYINNAEVPAATYTPRLNLRRHRAVAP